MTRLGLLLVATAPGACGGEDPLAPQPTPPPTGSIEVVVTTSGGSLDPDGYRVLVDGASAGTVAIDGTLSVEVDVGRHEVYLADNAFNCYVEQKEAVTVDVVEGRTVTVPLSVHCVTPLTDWVLYTTPTRGADETSIVRVFPANPNVSQRLVVGNAGHASLSADGTRLAFERGEQVYWMWVDGSGLTQVTQGEGREPRWSPDGSRIVFWATGVAGEGDIFVADADGSNLTNMTNSAAHETAPTWSPDGRSLAYRSEDQGDWIMIRTLDGTTPASALHGSTGLLDAPAWSPDGETIAFRQGSDIVVKSVDLGPGASVTVLVDSGVDSRNTAPAWSPDGRELVYVSRPSGGVSKLWVTSVSSYDPRRLFPASGSGGDYEIEPVWAPGSDR
jgi:TolB protein